MALITKCPQCGKILWFSEKLAGTLTICPACGIQMRLEPMLASSAPTPASYPPLTPGSEPTAANPPSAPPVPSEPPPIQISPPSLPDPNDPNAAVPDSDTMDLVPLDMGDVGPPSASGSTMPVTPPAPRPVSRPENFTAISPELIEQQQLPPAAQQSSLPFQAAAAAGEAHVDVDETDLVQWTMQASQPPPAHLPPPQWAPPALAAPPPRPPGGPAPRYDDARRPAGYGAEPSPRSSTPKYLWIALGSAAVIAVGAIIYLAGRSPDAGSWDVAHRQQILDIKQQAEQLAMDGKNREAYAKYQELENLVAGQHITDPYLSQELERSWRKRDLLYDLMIAGARQPQQPSPPLDSSAQPSNPPAPGGAASDEVPASQPSSVVSPPANVSEPQSAAPQSAAPTPTETEKSGQAFGLPPVIPPRPAAHPMPALASELTDASIGQAITKGTSYLLQQFDGASLAGADESVAQNSQPSPDPATNLAQWHEGLDSMSVYALLQCELATHDKRMDIHSPFMISAIEAMKTLPMKERDQTYARALRATALALYNRPADQIVLDKDVQWLLGAQQDGAYTYNDEFPRNGGFIWDNSNSQYGLLGVWSGAEAGVKVPDAYWRAVEKHWTDDQFKTGQWHYQSGEDFPSRSMTLAGIASLFVTQDYLGNQEAGNSVERQPFSPALARGMNWIEDGDNSVIDRDSKNEMDWTYTLYGLERVGLASGFKFFGSHDWYREEAAKLIAAQNADGSWDGVYHPIVSTSYALLFLARGRHPVIMSKLRFGEHWANRPRDVANLTRFASAELERPLNWQVLPLDRDWRDWTDSRILFLASDRPPRLTDEQVAKLRSFVENGGLLLTQADGGSPEFTQFAQQLGRKLFPQYPWTDLSADDPVCDVSYRVNPQAPIRVISNGSRILMMHWPTDLSVHWQLRQQDTDRWTFELGVNLALYASGKSELRNRVDSDQIPRDLPPAAATLPMARLRYDGNWDPEPAAWTRTARWFQMRTSLGLAPRDVDLASLASANPPLAHLTGTSGVQFSDAQVAAVRQYVTSGGVLLIDPCGRRDSPFVTSVRDDLLRRAFPDAELDRLDAAHPILSGGAEGTQDVSSPHVRDYVRALGEAVDAHPWMLRSGKGHVILLPLDLTSGLLGADTWGIEGYRPAYSLELMKNIVLWVWDGSKDP